MQRHTAASYVDFAILPKEQQNQKKQKKQTFERMFGFDSKYIFFWFSLVLFGFKSKKKQ